MERASLREYTILDPVKSDASLLMDIDVNPKEIQHRLGHVDYSITMNTYEHLTKDTAEKLSNYLESSIKSTKR